VSPKALSAKVFLSGAIDKKIKLVGIGVTKGAKAAIEAAGGSVEAPAPAKPVAKRIVKAA